MAVRSDAMNLQPIKFASAQEESELLKRLGQADKVQVRLSQPDDQDVEGHQLSKYDTVVLASLAVDDDDVEGHVISIHFPDAEQARHFRNQLIAAGALTATLALGVGAGTALAPSLHIGVPQASAPTVASQTFTGVREGGGLSVSAADQARFAAAAATSQAAADAARSAAGISGTMAGVDSTTANSAIASSDAVGAQAGDSIAERAAQVAPAGTVNPAAAADAARVQAGITGSLAGAPTDDASTRAREAGDLSIGTGAVNAQAAADAARAAAGITGSLAGVDSRTADSAATASSDSIGAQAGDSIAERAAQVGPAGAFNPAAAADAARVQAGITGSLAGGSTVTPSADTATQAREAGALSASSDTVASQSGDSIAERAAQSASTVTPSTDTATQAREAGPLSSSTTTPRAGDSQAERSQSGTTDEDPTPTSGFNP